MSVLTLPEEDWPTVTRRVARAEGPVAWSWIAFLNPNTHEWELAALCIRGATPTEKRLLCYPVDVIGTEQLSPRAAAKRLREGRVTTLRGVGRELRFDVQNQMRFTPLWMTSERDSRWNLVPVGWPQYFLFHTSVGATGTVQVQWQDPLQARNMPFYPSARDAVSSLVYGVPANQIQLSGSAHVLIRLPDYRARIQPGDATGGMVRVGVEEGKPNGACGCVLRAAWRRDGHAVDWCHRDVVIEHAGQVDVETGEVPAEMWIILTSPEGQVLDRYGWSDTSTLAPEQTGDLVQLIERWVQDGEGQRVEFKQALDQDKAKVRFAQTVCAMANAEGGVILVGIADDRAVIGWDRPGVSDRITNIVREHVKEYVPVTVTTVEVRSHKVHVVNVPPGEVAAKPYRCDDVVMIRANGTTARASTWEIRQLARQAETRISDSIPPFTPG